MSDNFIKVSSHSRKSNLEILGLSGVLQRIAENRQSGILYIQISCYEKYLYFKDGLLIMVTSPNRSSVLAEGLRRSFHQISEEDLNSLFSEQAATGESLSQLLLKAGADENFIVEICAFQMREEVYDLFRWSDIQFDFVEEESAQELFRSELLALPIALEVDLLLLEAARRLDVWEKINQKLPSAKDIPYIAQDLYEGQLTSEETHLLSLVDGGNDFEDIIYQCRLSEFQAWQHFYKMYTQNYIELRSAEELRDMAELEEFRGNTAKCIKLYERAEELGSKDINSLRWLAEAYEWRGLLGKAIQKYKELGEKYLEKQNFAGAIEAYKKVIDYAPEDLEAHAHYVETLFEDGKFLEGAQASIVYAKKLAVEDKREAIQVLEDAYQHNPLSPEVLEQMAQFYCELNENIDAIFTYTTLANLYKSRGLYQDTIHSYQKILSLDEDNIEARIELANTYLLMGKHEEGVRQYKKLGKILTNSEFIKQPFVFSYLINVCEKIIEFEPDNLSAREWLADVYLYHKKKDKAEEVLLELLDFFGEEDKAEALISVLQKLVTIDPQNREHHRKLAKIYHLLELTEKETAVLSKLAELAQKNGEAAQNQGESYQAQLAYQESLEAMNRIISLEPFRLNIRKQRAKLLKKLDQREEAIKELKLIAHMTRAIHENEEALQTLDQIIELVPEQEVKSLLEIARLCERQNKIREAIAHYKKYAQMSLEQGNLGDVLSTCRRLAVLAPQDEQIKKWKSLAHEMVKN